MIYVEVDSQTKRVMARFGTNGPLPVFDPRVRIAVDVTNLNPLPEPGWLYNPQTGVFTQSSFPGPAVDPDRQATTTLVSKASNTFTTADLADLLKQIAKRLYQIG